MCLDLAGGLRVIVAAGTVLATYLLVRRVKRGQDSPCKKQTVVQEVKESSKVRADDNEVHPCKKQKVVQEVKESSKVRADDNEVHDTVSTALPSGLVLLSELQMLMTAPFDAPSLGRLAACSSQLRATADAPQVWQRHFDALNIAVRAHLNLGVPPDPDALQGQGKAFAPGCRVRLHGLTQANFNGSLGTVLPESTSSGRVAVQVDAPQGKSILLKPENLTLVEASESEATLVHPKALLRQALGAFNANEAFYAAFRAGQRHRMRALWLDEARVKPEMVAQLLGAPLRTLGPDGINNNTILPQRGKNFLMGTRCVHPGQGLLVGHSVICQSWDGILGSVHRPTEIHPVNCKWELDGHGRARVTQTEQLQPGLCIPSTNAFVLHEDTWRIVSHVAS